MGDGIIRNHQFGKYLTIGLTMVALMTERTLRAVEQEVADELGFSVPNIERWRRGHIPKKLAHTEYLASYCINHSCLNDEWAKNFLHYAEYPSYEEYIQKLFPNRPQRLVEASIFHNLPPRRTDLIGRQMDLIRVREALNSRWPIVSIQGGAGIGKTLLATEIGYDYLSLSQSASIPLFAAIVWVSTQNYPERKRWFNEVLDTVAKVLKSHSLIDHPQDKKVEEINKLLQTYSTLIIIDNFDAIDDPDLVAWLDNIPDPTKILLTSRTDTIRGSRLVHLQGLEERDAITLICTHAKALELSEIEQSDDEEDQRIRRALVQVTGGHPLAIKMALGHVKYEQLPLEDVTEHIVLASKEVDDIFAYFIAQIWKVLPDDARYLLMIVPFFADAITPKALAAVTGLADDRLQAALTQVVERSWLTVEGELKRQARRYTVHPLIRAYASAQLREYPAWELQARQRWITYYLNYLNIGMGRAKIEEPYWQYLGGGKVQTIRAEWPNLLKVLEWAQRQRHYDVLIKFLERLFHYMDRRAFHSIRIDYAREGASAAQILGQLVQRQERFDWLLLSEFPDQNLFDYVTVMEALFRIDALGVALRKIEHYDEAIVETNRGLELVNLLVPNNPEIHNLRALGYAFLAKVYIEQGNLEEALKWKKQARELEQNCTTVIQHRVLVVAADLEYKKKEYERAKELYQEAYNVGRSYRAEGDTDMAGVHRKLGECHLALGEYKQAEVEFQEVINDQGQGGDLNDVQAKFGLAKVLKALGQKELARHWAVTAKKALSDVSIEHSLHKEINAFLYSL